MLSLAAIALVIIFVIRDIKLNSFTLTSLTLAIISMLMIIVAIGSGAILNAAKEFNPIVTIVHKISPHLAVAFTSFMLFVLIKG